MLVKHLSKSRIGFNKIPRHNPFNKIPRHNPTKKGNKRMRHVGVIEVVVVVGWEETDGSSRICW